MSCARRAEEFLAGRGDDFAARLQAMIDEAHARAIILDDVEDVEGAKAHRAMIEGACDLLDLLWERSQANAKQAA